MFNKTKKQKHEDKIFEPAEAYRVSYHQILHDGKIKKSVTEITYKTKRRGSEIRQSIK